MLNMTKGVFFKMLPILGSLVLFLSWVFSQSLLGDANSALQKIFTAQSVFQTYQSNNALFNGLIATVRGEDDAIDRIRRTQVYNYELGLRDLEHLLDEAEKAELP